ncbi:unnamed protein product [Brassica napus]|uniref:(rape) hypothetical protein n=1 Tax=Brassica napus TaxID=3708 RepID=A0A816IZW1_BRANA|nr:unnamed protein product [Brassica napus]
MEDICNGHLSLSLSLTSDFLFLVTAVVVSKRRRLDPSSPVSSFPHHHRSRSLPPSPPVSSFALVTTGLELAPVTTGLELVPVVIAIAGAGDGDRTEEDIEKRGKGGRRRRQQRE